MYCSQCGKNIPADSTFCPECGKSLAVPAGQSRLPDRPYHASPPTSAASSITPALKWGIVIGTVFFWPLGIIMGLIYRRDPDPEKKKVGSIWLWFGIAVAVVVFLFWVLALSTPSYY